MDHDKPLDDFATALSRIQPSAPDVSPGSIMFEAGRQLGSSEAAAARANSLRTWRLAAACSLILAVASVSLWMMPPRDQGNNMAVRNDPAEDQVQKLDLQDQRIEAPLATQLPPSNVRTTAFLDWGLLTQISSDSDQSPLARRHRMLRQGVAGLPEMVSTSSWPVTTSPGRYELMNQLLDSESL